MAKPDVYSTPAANGDDLRIVLFGLPGAGKSSLLGALGQASQTQEHLLHGRLKDLAQGLTTLQTRLYDEAPSHTAEEVAPHPLAFEPMSEESTEAINALVLDCDGHVAQELVTHPDLLGVPEGALAQEVVQADTLVLAVDAAKSHEQLETDFTAFERFLREMETGRSARAAVGGLPVFLVLTKCDLLAEAGDTTVDWIERIEQRKREVDEHFRTFLTRRGGETGPLPFGQVDLHLWATAVKRPPLAGAEAKPREPYGVAELFRQCFERASAYRRRCRQARRRLIGTAGTAVSLVSALILLALFLVLRPAARPPSELQRTIEALQFTEKPTPAERLRAPLSELRLRRERLRRLQSNPEFAVLPENLRTFVVTRTNEFDQYIEWMDQVQAVRRPVTIDTEAGLHEIKEELEKLEPQRHEEWKDTEAMRLYRERLDEVHVLLDGVQRVQAAYLGDAKKAWKLWSFDGYPSEGGVNWRLWSADLEDLRRQFKSANFKQTDKLPGSPTLTYAAVMRIDAAIEASTLRQRLERVRNLCAALGLIGPIADKPPVLVIDKPPGFPLSMAKTRWQELQKAYTDYKGEFVRSGLPEALLREVDRAALTNYEFLLEPARSLVLSELRKAGEGDEETAARWNAVRNWLLRDPEELTAWRALAVLLVHLHDPYAADPVTALAAFLGETTFSLDIKRLTVELPDSLRSKAPSTAALSVYHPRTSGKEPALVFEQSSEAKRDPDRRVTIYNFELKKGTRLVYVPGDELWATLPLRDGMQLTWTRNRSTMFQFERLLRAPRLHKTKENSTEGELVEEVRVFVSPPEGWPRAPDLLPGVRLSR
jgi:GTPase SAR1 family protein